MKLKNLLKESNGNPYVSEQAWTTLNAMANGSEFKKAFDRLLQALERDPKYPTNVSIQLQKLYDALYKSIKKYE